MRFSTWICCGLSFGLVATVVPAAVREAAYTTDPELLRQLQERQQQQRKALPGSLAARPFKFTNRVEQSGITFEHQIVDDAGKFWKPAHYDHGNGLAVADVDGDGREDLYFVTQLGANQLWRNLGKGRFEDITAAAGVGLSNRICVSASFADIDNDGDPDLYVTTVRKGNVLFENTGQGRFKEITVEAGLAYTGHSSAAVFFDFDRDGRLDLFLANVGVYTGDEQGKGGYYRALTNAFHGHLFPERTEYSRLYRNLGGRRFQDVSADVNLRDGSWSCDASFCDLDADGFPDLYVVNMQGDNHYYANLAGKRFEDRTAAHFPKTPWGAMGLKFFDFNNDGLMDLYVTDMHSDMTEKQKTDAAKLQVQVEKAKSEAYCTVQWTDAFLQGASNNIFGNAFYVNRGGGRFEERSDALGAETFWPWGPSVGDLNADGFEDIFVAAGMGFPFRYGINSLLLNDAGQRFLDAELLAGVEPRAANQIQRRNYLVLDCSGEDAGNPLCGARKGLVPIRGALSTRSAALFDLDDDGDLDIVTSEFSDRPQVLINDLAQQKPVNALQISLRGSVSNRDGLGATVKMTAAGKTQTRYHDGKSGYLTQSLLPLYFGLGDSTEVDKVEVVWPSGKRQVMDKPAVKNRRLEITEPRE